MISKFPSNANILRSNFQRILREIIKLNTASPNDASGIVDHYQGKRGIKREMHKVACWHQKQAWMAELAFEYFWVRTSPE